MAARSGIQKRQYKRQRQAAKCGSRGDTEAVLVAGGKGTHGQAYASCELYDPSTGTWSETGSLNTARGEHTATLLQNGMVLVAGGDDGGGDYFSSCELYNPSTGIWSATESLTASNVGFTATLLPSGQVLAAGGLTPGEHSTLLSSCELYDPSSGTWASTGDLANARYEHTATLLPNGKVLVAGGAGTGGASFSSCELFDPSLPDTTPGTQAWVSATAADAQATVSITPPASNGGSAITSYTVTSTPDNITASGPAGSITVSGLTNGIAYTFTATATNSVGTGQPSSPSNSVTPLETAPGAPTGVQATAGNAQATVSFNPPTSDGGSPITSYIVTSSPGNITASGPASPITVTGLTNGTSYVFTVNAINAVGMGPTSSPSNHVIPQPPTNGACGSSNGGAFTSAPTTNLCSAGNPTTVSGSGPWSWSCTGSNGANASCSANAQTTPVNGACGSSNGGAFTSAPTNNLCSAGNPTTVSGSGPWSWSCTGSNGGTNASCSANAQATPVNGACGSSNGGAFTSAPTTNLCSAGTLTKVTGSGPWSWTCQGINGGTNASCSAHVPIKPSVTSFQINNGDASTPSRTVTLNNTATENPTQYLASQSSTFLDATWQPYSMSSKFTLSPGNGTKAVYFKVKNAAGASQVLSDTIVLAQLPVITSFKINGVAASTLHQTVTLNNTATITPTQYMASEDPNFTGAKWKAYGVAPSFTLSAGSGIKTVYIKVKNGVGESTVVSDTIQLIVKPTLTSFQINNGVASTPSRIVTLNNTATENPTQYMASQSSTFIGALWKTYSAAPPFSLSAGKGMKKVYFKVKNAAGVSNVMSATITLD